MLRVVEDAGGGALFDYPALAHDDEVVGHRADDFEIVARLQVAQEVAW